MDILRRAVVPLRVMLGLTFAILVVFQVLSMPGQFRAMAEEDPDSAYLRWPLTVFSIVEILCIQIAIACTWRLLTMVQQDRIFTDEALRWTDAIIGAIATGWVLFAGAFLYVGFHADDPGLPMLMMLVLLAGGAFGLLVLVMRGLLGQATTLRTDLEGVI